MKANSMSEVPDPVIIYNYSLIEGEAAGSEEDVGLMPLGALNESPERNTLMFALQLKQTEYFSNSFYLNRRFNPSFFRNQTIASFMNKSYEYLK